jgi:hypothetical protein
MAKFTAGQTVVCIDASNRQGITEGRTYKVERVSTSGTNIAITNNHGNLMSYPTRRFQKEKTAKEIAYDTALVLHHASGGLYPMPKKPIKTPRSVKIDPKDAKEALSKMLKEVYGIDATVEQVIGAMDKSLELVLGA